MTQPAAQYQHHIPRFVLRRYKVEHPSKPVNNSKKRRGKKKVQQSDLEVVLFYDLTTRILDIRPIKDVYGVRSLYQDARSTKHVNELEERLSQLENQASKVIRDLHDTLDNDMFITLERRDINRLRKFLFLLHYRRDEHSQTYFQDNINPSIQDWLLQFRAKHGLKDSTELWLFALRYYLDTSHYQLCLDAQEMYDKYGKLQIALMMETSQIDPDMEHYFALAYAKQANSYFLCFWEAAEGTEFILGHNSAGLWEGLSLGDELHRLFVVSPRLAVVLRNNTLREGYGTSIFTETIISDLADIEQLPPLPIYANRKVAANSSTLFKHRISPQADNDRFAFKITKLTRSQMQAFNSVTLLNARSEGSITFLSREYMLEMARTHCRSPVHYADQQRYEPLIRELSSSLTEVSSPTPISADNTNASLSPNDVKLNILILQVAHGETRFKTDFDRAMFVFQTMKTAYPFSRSEFITKCGRMSTLAVSRYLDRYPPPTTHSPPADFPLLLPEEKSRELLTAFIPLMESLGCRIPSTSPLDTLLNNAVVVHLMAWTIRDSNLFEALKDYSPALKAALTLPSKQENTDDKVDVEDADQENEDQTAEFRRALLHIHDDHPKVYSRYEKARKVFQLCMAADTPNPFSLGCQELITDVIQMYTLSTPNVKSTQVESSPRVSPLVESLSNKESAQLFTHLEDLMAFERPKNSYSTLLMDAAYFGFLSWLFVNRPDEAKRLLPGFHLLPSPDLPDSPYQPHFLKISIGLLMILCSCIVLYISLIMK